MRKLLLLLPLCLGGLARAEDMPMGPGMEMGDRLFAHALLDQFEARPGDQFRWDGQGWVGGDYDKLWIKSEGLAGRGQVEDGQNELLYDRAVTTFFDLQAGLRADFDRGRSRQWAAIGLQGLAPYYIDVEATAYIGESGRTAARVKASCDLLLTQRLILEPEAEVEIYGTGGSDLDAGLRLRYEISRKFAPYFGLSYRGSFGGTADFARLAGEAAADARIVIGIRAWY